jgi:hypothetical protein
VAEECQPGGAIGVLSRLVVMGENSSNHVFVDFDLDAKAGCTPTRILPAHLADQISDLAGKCGAVSPDDPSTDGAEPDSRARGQFRGFREAQYTGQVDNNSEWHYTILPELIEPLKRAFGI